MSCASFVLPPCSSSYSSVRQFQRKRGPLRSEPLTPMHTRKCVALCGRSAIGWYMFVALMLGVPISAPYVIEIVSTLPYRSITTTQPALSTWFVTDPMPNAT